MINDPTGIKTRLASHQTPEEIWLCLTHQLIDLGQSAQARGDVALEIIVGEMLMHTVELGRRLGYEKAQEVWDTFDLSGALDAHTLTGQHND